MPKAGVRLPFLSDSHDRASMPKAGVRLPLLSDHQDRASMPKAGVRLPHFSATIRIEHPCRRLGCGFHTSQRLSR
eukprot:scaffold6153_cov49-Phaeocystis_antarctica.AAC.1